MKEYRQLPRQGPDILPPAEVETVLSLLSVIDNPMQDIPMAAVLRSPMVGMNDDEMAWMMAAYKRYHQKRTRTEVYMEPGNCGRRCRSAGLDADGNPAEDSSKDKTQETSGVESDHKNESRLASVEVPETIA